MLYLTQRYLLGIGSLAFFVITAIVFIPFHAPSMAPNLSGPTSFIPLLDVFLVSGSLVMIMAILSAHPLVTDGLETRTMTSPLSHPGVHATLLALVLLTPLYGYLLTINNPDWKAERLEETLIFLFSVTGLTFVHVCLSFYVLKAKAKEAWRFKKLAGKAHKTRS